MLCICGAACKNKKTCSPFKRKLVGKKYKFVGNTEPFCLATKIETFVTNGRIFYDNVETAGYIRVWEIFR